eukprot:TRINITY_DN1785_c0_g1_i1.p1 TRINITY_DN1785_c0_g1~~TRINITY_DN1785_c0_g1_i1.p1  ORF type:complete len:1870 (+),score=572.99 TRINITY_DN1785_c0_g1_i1:99-5708(+)
MADGGGEAPPPAQGGGGGLCDENAVRQVRVILRKERLAMQRAPCAVCCEFCCPGFMGVLAGFMIWIPTLFGSDDPLLQTDPVPSYPDSYPNPDVHMFVGPLDVQNAPPGSHPEQFYQAVRRLQVPTNHSARYYPSLAQYKAAEDSLQWMPGNQQRVGVRIPTQWPPTAIRLQQEDLAPFEQCARAKYEIYGEKGGEEAPESLKQLESTGWCPHNLASQQRAALSWAYGTQSSPSSQWPPPDDGLRDFSLSIAVVEEWSFNSLAQLATIAGQLSLFGFFVMQLVPPTRLIEEKRTRMRELLLVMGMKKKTYYIGHILSIVAFQALCLLFLMAPLIGFDAVPRTGAGIITTYLFCVLHAIALLGVSFLAAAVFSRPLLAVFVLVFWFLAAYTAWGLTVAFCTEGALVAFQWIACIHPVVPYLHGITQIFSRGLLVDEISIGVSAVLMIVDAVVYFVLGLYISEVFPGQYGVPKAWNFLCMPPSQQEGRLRGNPPPKRELDPANFQPPDAHLKPIVSLRGVTKQFPDFEDTPAVHHLDLDIFAGQIFVLLGHNGAGKTTTFNMLVGLLPMTVHQRAEVLGRDLATELQAIRLGIGVCPQHDVLFPALTVMEHLRLYSRIKAHRTEQDLEDMARRTAAHLELPLDRPAGHLSGGMKRRLSLACALVAENELVFLDEPSSGLDPVNRHHVWDILRQHQKKGTTIVLTTHFMEEAEVLGDRVGIMSKGTLHCCGNPSFLKSRFGCGYYLRANMLGDDDSIERRLSEVVAQHVPTVQQNPRQGKELIYVLPQGTVSSFGGLFQAIEADAGLSAGLGSVGLAQNTLEDVFVDIAMKETTAEGAAAEQVAVDFSILPGNEVRVAAGGCSLLMAQMQALWRRRMVTLMRYKMTLAFSLIVPVIMILAAMLVITNAANPSETVTYFRPGEQPGSGGKGGGGKEWRRAAALQDPADDWVPRVGYTQNSGSLSLVMVDFNSNPHRERLEQLIEQAHIALGGTGVHWLLADNEDTFNKGYYIPFAPGPPELYRDELPRGGYKLLTLNSLTDISKDNVDITTFAGPYHLGHEEQSVPYLTANRGLVYYLVDLLYAAFALEAGLQTVLTTQMDTLRRNSSMDVFRICKRHSDCGDESFPPVSSNVQGMFCAAHCLTGSCGAGGSVDGGLAAPAGWGYCQPCFHSNPWQGYCTAQSHSIDGSCAVCGGTQANSIFIRVVTYSFAVLGASIFLLIGLMTGPCMLGMEVAEDMQMRVYQHLRVVGMKPLAYLLSNLVFDTGLGLVSCVVPFLVFAAAMKAYPFMGGGTLACFLLVLLTYPALALFSTGWAVLVGDNVTPFRTLLALMAINPGLFFLPEIIDVIVEATSSSVGESGMEKYRDAKPYMYVATPQGAFLYALKQIEQQYLKAPNKKELAASDALDFHDGAGLPLLFLAIHILWQCAALALWTILNDRARAEPPVMSPTASTGGQTDQDVRAEAQRVQQGKAAEDLVVVNGLRQVYKSGKVAVQSLTFGMPQGECFGLLGPNGAGKTTAIRALIGEIMPTGGQISFPGMMEGEATSVTRTQLYRQCALAVCAQHDALWPAVTGAEHMEIYLAMRYGTAARGPRVREFIESVCELLSFREHADKTSGAYSGGTKRKLGVALAMFTGSALVFLDEPSTGMDPFSRRALWRAIAAALVRQQGSGVLLTTHSMEEASSCCQRIAIMTDGLMRCIGTDNHLKARFGTGYTLMVYMKPAEDAAVGYQQVQQLELKLRELYPLLELVEVHGLQRRYLLGKVTSLGNCFAALEAVKPHYAIDEYSISQNSSLEQIFIMFTGSSAVLQEDQRLLRRASSGNLPVAAGSANRQRVSDSGAHPLQPPPQPIKQSTHADAAGPEAQAEKETASA